MSQCCSFEAIPSNLPTYCNAQPTGMFLRQGTRYPGPAVTRIRTGDLYVRTWAEYSKCSGNI
eukprot:3936507-Rhodomonas_salina.1